MKRLPACRHCHVTPNERQLQHGTPNTIRCPNAACPDPRRLPVDEWTALNGEPSLCAKCRKEPTINFSRNLVACHNCRTDWFSRLGWNQEQDRVREEIRSKKAMQVKLKEKSRPTLKNTNLTPVKVYVFKGVHSESASIKDNHVLNIEVSGPGNVFIFYSDGRVNRIPGERCIIEYEYESTSQPF